MGNRGSPRARADELCVITQDATENCTVVCDYFRSKDEYGRVWLPRRPVFYSFDMNFYLPGPHVWWKNAECWAEKEERIREILWKETFWAETNAFSCED